MKIQKISQFFSEVKQQMRHVVWPTVSETKITTLIVFVLAVVFAIYFLIVDRVWLSFIRLILN